MGTFEEFIKISLEITGLDTSAKKIFFDDDLIKKYRELVNQTER